MASLRNRWLSLDRKAEKRKPGVGKRDEQVLIPVVDALKKEKPPGLPCREQRGK